MRPSRWRSARGAMLVVAASLVFSPADVGATRPDGGAAEHRAPGDSGHRGDRSDALRAQSDERVYAGRVDISFEVSSFVEGFDACPGYGQGDWLVPNDAFQRRWDAVFGEELWPSTLESRVAYVRFVGRRSGPGEHGHLGSYEHEMRVLEIVELRPDERCGRRAAPTPDPRPDLVVDALGGVLLGVLPDCVQPGPKIGLGFCVANDGGIEAGPSRYASDAVQRRSFPLRAIPPGAIRCPEPRPWTFASHDPAFLYLDVDDEVDERNEANNRAAARRPTYEPPPLPTCAAPPPTPALALPDLVLVSARHSLVGFHAHCDPRGGASLVGACVLNRGRGPAGAFRVVSDRTDVAWRVPGLDPGERYCTELRPGSVGRLVADPDGNVMESAEDNNELTGIVPPTPPPACTAPPGAPTLAATSSVPPTVPAIWTPAPERRTAWLPLALR